MELLVPRKVEEFTNGTLKHYCMCDLNRNMLLLPFGEMLQKSLPGMMWGRELARRYNQGVKWYSVYRLSLPQ